MRHSFLFLVVAAVCAFSVSPVSAESSWDDIRPQAFGERVIHPAGDVVKLSAPNRPEDQSEVPVKVEAAFRDGRTIRAVTIIVDENPSPVAAVFDIGGKRTALKLGTKFRFNTGTDVRAVVEASDGQLYMASRHVKFAGGQAACSAPPNGDPKEILANMGKMTFGHETKLATASQIRPNAKLKVSHPNHSGMVLDQITLLYVPLRIVSEMEVRQGKERVFSMRGSMTLSQDPEIEFDYRVNGSESMQVTVTDTNGASWQESFPIGQGS